MHVNTQVCMSTTCTRQKDKTDGGSFRISFDMSAETALFGETDRKLQVYQGFNTFKEK